MFKFLTSEDLFRLCLAPDDGGGDGGNDSNDNDDGSNEEFIDKIDPVTKKSYKIPKSLEPLLGHFISATRKDTEAQYKPILEKLENENTELSEVKIEFDKLKEAQMSAEELAQLNAKKVIQEHEKKRKDAEDEAAKWKSLYESSTIKTDILSSFGETKLFNPEQVATLMEKEGNAKISEIVDNDGKGTGEYQTRLTLVLENKDGDAETVEGTAKELFKRWIELDRNSHHIINSLPSGSGARSSTGSRVSKQDVLEMEPGARMDHAREQAKSK